jgi:hypothetical protein
MACSRTPMGNEAPCAVFGVGDKLSSPPNTERHEGRHTICGQKCPHEAHRPFGLRACPAKVGR